MIINESILILGCHRSGTSTLSAILNLCGYSLPGGEVNVPAHENPAGYYENRAVVQLNNRILTAMGLRWDDPVPIDLYVTEAMKRKFRDDVMRVVEHHFTCSGYVLKDPRMSTLWPFWIDALQEASSSPIRAILALRNPMQVSRSLVRRHQIVPHACSISSVEDGLKFWLVQTLGAVRGALNFNFAISDSDKFNESPLDAIRTLRERLSLSVDVEALESAVKHFVECIRRNDLYRSEIITIEKDDKYGVVYNDLLGAITPSKLIRVLRIGEGIV